MSSSFKVFSVRWAVSIALPHRQDYLWVSLSNFFFFSIEAPVCLLHNLNSVNVNSCEFINASIQTMNKIIWLNHAHSRYCMWHNMLHWVVGASWWISGHICIDAKKCMYLVCSGSGLILAGYLCFTSPSPPSFACHLLKSSKALVSAIYNAAKPFGDKEFTMVWILWCMSFWSERENCWKRGKSK